MNEMEKIKKTSRGIDVFVLVVQIAALVGAALSLIIIIMGFASPDFMQNPGNAVTTITFGDIDLKLKSADVLPDDFGRVLALGVIPGFITLIAVAVICVFGRRLLKPMKLGETPFSEGNHKNMFAIGWTAIIAAVVAGVFEGICTSAMLKSLNLESFFNPDVVESVTCDSAFNAAPIVAALVIFLLAYIFKYGEQLQKESDETL